MENNMDWTRLGMALLTFLCVVYAGLDHNWLAMGLGIWALHWLLTVFMLSKLLVRAGVALKLADALIQKLVKGNGDGNPQA